MENIGADLETTPETFDFDGGICYNASTEASGAKPLLIQQKREARLQSKESLSKAERVAQNISEYKSLTL